MVEAVETPEEAETTATSTHQRGTESGKVKANKAKQAATASVRAISRSSAIAVIPSNECSTHAVESTTATPGIADAGEAPSGAKSIAKLAKEVSEDREQILTERATLEYDRWPATLDARWAEVEFVLCRAIESEESLRYTTEATEAGLVFMEKLEKKAQVTILAKKVQANREHATTAEVLPENRRKLEDLDMLFFARALYHVAHTQWYADPHRAIQI